jgi:hypothetical protein
MLVVERAQAVKAEMVMMYMVRSQALGLAWALVELLGTQTSHSKPIKPSCQKWVFPLPSLPNNFRHIPDVTPIFLSDAFLIMRG